MSAAIIETPRAALGSAPVRAAPAYTLTARVLHWITAAAILLMLPLGWASANEWGGTWQDWLYDLHRSIGAALIPLLLVRVIYRITHPPLPLPDAIAPLKRRGMQAAALPLRGSWRCMWQPRAITISSARTACSCACSRAEGKYRDLRYLARNYNH